MCQVLYYMFQGATAFNVFTELKYGLKQSRHYTITNILTHHNIVGK